MDTPGLVLLRQELAKHHIDPQILGHACLMDIVACAEKPVRSLAPSGRIEDSGLFVHTISGLSTHVAGLLGAYGPGWPGPKEDVIAEILRRYGKIP